MSEVGDAYEAEAALGGPPGGSLGQGRGGVVENRGERVQAGQEVLLRTRGQQSSWSMLQKVEPRRGERPVGTKVPGRGDGGTRSVPDLPRLREGSQRCCWSWPALKLHLPGHPCAHT